MKKKILIPLLILIAALAAIFYYMKMQKRAQESELILYGNVDVRQAELGFRVFGRIDSLYFDEGDLVQPGELMAELDPVPYIEEVNQAAARVKSIEKKLSNAELIYNRRKELVLSGAVSEEDYFDALAASQELAADLKEAEAALASAKTNLEDTKLYSPSRGTILTRVREPGSVVNAGNPVFSLSILDPVWVRAYIAEPELGTVYPGMKASISTDTPGGHLYDGHVGFISPVAEFTPKTVETTSLRTDLVYRIRVVVDNPDYSLKQGMPVTVYLDTDQSG